MQTRSNVFSLASQQGCLLDWIITKEVNDTANLSSSEEGLVLGVAEASGVGATFILTQPIDPAIKAVACAILGFISITLNAFWLKYVNITQAQTPKV
jgi:hypothetical protein